MSLLIARRGSIAQESSFTPDDIATLSAWFDAAATSTITSTSGTVSSWNDRSSNGYDLTTVNGDPKTGTRTVNGLNVVDFDGVDDGLYRDNAPVNNAADGSWTIYAVVVADAPASLGSVVDGDDSIGTLARTGQFLRINSSDLESIAFNSAPSAFSDAAGATLTTATTYLLTSVNTGTTVEAFVNTVGNGATTITNGQVYHAGAPLLLGARYQDEGTNTWVQFFDGAICEVLCYSDELSAQDQSNVETYLTDKWGITL